jgi:hypothetical protein
MTDEAAVYRATFGGHAMLWSVENIVNPELERRALKTLKITIGADLGNILLARIGVARTDNPLVAVGLTANRAAKILEACGPGQFRVGEAYCDALPREIKSLFRGLLNPENWPFTVRKSNAEYLDDVKLSEQKAAEEQERRRRLSPPPPPFSGGLATPSRSPLYTPLVVPETVSWYRPYRIYRYAGL